MKSHIFLLNNTFIKSHIFMKYHFLNIKHSFSQNPKITFFTKNCGTETISIQMNIPKEETQRI